MHSTAVTRSERSRILFVSRIPLQSAPSYNTAVALLAIVAHHTRRGRHIFAALLALFLSLIPDVILLLSLDMHVKLNYISVLLVPLNACFKIVGCVAAYSVFVSIGGTWSLAESQVAVEGSGLHERDVRAVSSVDSLAGDEHSSLGREREHSFYTSPGPR